MSDYKIVANGVTLDTSEEIQSAFTYKVEDIKDLSKKETNFSRTIKLPSTANNNKFFKHIADVNIDNISYNPAISIPTKVYIGDDLIFTGNMQLLSIDDNQQDMQYNVSVHGNLISLYTQFGDLELRNIDLSKYNHTRNIDTITASHYYEIQKFGGTASIGEAGEGYVYPYAVYGDEDEIYDKCLLSSLYPAVYVKTLTDSAIEQFTDFTVTSEFFESDYYKKLVIPASGEKIQLPAQELDNRKAIIGVTYGSTYVSNMPYYQSPDTSTNGNWWYSSAVGYQLPLERESGTVDSNGNELTFTDSDNQIHLGIFTASNSGYYTLDLDMKMFLQVYRDGGSGNVTYTGNGGIEYQYEVRLQRAGVAGYTVISDSSTSADPNNAVNEIVLDTDTHPATIGSPHIYSDEIIFASNVENLYLETGDSIYVQYAYKMNGNENIWTGTSDTDVYCKLVFKQSYDSIVSKMSVVPTTPDSYGNEYINLSSTLPEKWKIKDFFTDLVKMFNLIIMDNPEKEGDLIIEPRDDFYNSRKKIREWDELLDNDKDVTQKPLSELDAKTYLYKYKDDDDWLNKEYKNETNRSYGEYSIDVLNDFSDKVNKTEIKFSSTPISNRYIKDRVAPFFITKEGDDIKNKKAKPRILFYGGRYSCDTWYIKEFYDEDDADSTPLNYYPYIGHFDDPYSPIYDLNFGRTSKLYYNPSQIPNLNLVNQFHKSSLNNIINKNSRLLTAYFKLRPKDIADFDFRDIIKLKGQYWRVNRIIDYNPVGKDSTTKVELYKIVDLFTEGKYKIEIPTSNNSCPADVRLNIQTGIYTTKSGAGISEDCCAQLGGQYIDGVCRIVQPEGEGSLGALPSGNGGSFALGSGNEHIMPVAQPSGPSNDNRNGNTINTPSAMVIGSKGYVSSASKNSLIVGDNSSATGKNSLVIGDNIDAVGDNQFQIGEVIIAGSGSITTASGSSPLSIGTVSLDYVQGGIDSNSIVIASTQSNITGSDSSIILSSNGATVSDSAYSGIINAHNKYEGSPFPQNIQISGSTGSTIIGYTNQNPSVNQSPIFDSENCTIISGDFTTIATSSNCVVMVGGNIFESDGSVSIGASSYISNSSNSFGIGYLSYIKDSSNSFCALDGIIKGSTASVCIGDSMLQYSEDSGIFTGYLNELYSAQYSTILGGFSNNMTGSNSSGMLGGGGNDMTNSDYSSIVGGSSNDITNSPYSSVIGGISNGMTGSNSSGMLGGGSNDITNSPYSSVIGGIGNVMTDCNSSGMLGGSSNDITNSFNSSVIGGFSNGMTGSTRSSIVGGSSNDITNSDYSSIVGGSSNDITNSPYSSVIGGISNDMTDSYYSSMLSGRLNDMSDSYYSSMLGGFDNNMAGLLNSSIVGGNQCGMTGSSNSSIVGGFQCGMIGSYYSSIISGSDNIVDTADQSGIFAGNENEINTADQAVIIGGYSNVIRSGSDNSGIISAYNATIFNNTNNTVIIGGVNISTSLDNNVVVPDFAIRKSASVPSSSSSTTGELGQITWDSNYIYLKTSVFPSSVWKRAALSTF